MLKYVYNVYGNKGMIWIVYVLCEVLRTTMKRGALYIPSLLSFFFLFFKNIFLIIQEHCFFFKTWRQLCTVISLLKFGQCVWQSALACWKKLTGTYLEVQLLWTFKLSSPSYLICTQLTEMVSAFLRTKKEKKYAKHGVNQIRGCGLSRFYLPCMDLHPRW